MSKYHIAGGSARFMFGYSRDQVLAYFNAAMRRGGELLPLFQGVGDTCDDIRNTLLARYDATPLPTIVSRYAAQRLAIWLGPYMLPNMRRGLDIRPLMSKYYVETSFFLMLGATGVEYSISVNGRLEREYWERETIVPIDLAKGTLEVMLNRPTWLAPVKWNRGDCDAVLVDQEAKLVRFVLLTHADTHTFQPSHFRQLLVKIMAQKVDVAIVELFYVVPMDVLPVFRLPMDDQALKKDVVDAVFPHGECQGRVVAAGVEFIRSIWGPNGFKSTIRRLADGTTLASRPVSAPTSTSKAPVRKRKDASQQTEPSPTKARKSDDLHR